MRLSSAEIRVLAYVAALGARCRVSATRLRWVGSIAVVPRDSTRVHVPMSAGTTIKVRVLFATGGREIALPVPQTQPEHKDPCAKLATGGPVQGPLAGRLLPSHLQAGLSEMPPH